LADALGVSESSLKRWADGGLVKVTRTAGGHRRITLTEAVRYIRTSGMTVVNPRALGLSDLTEMSAQHLARPNNNDQPLVDAILAGQAERTRGLILSMYISGRSISEICDGPVARAMHIVGDLWKHSESGILVEHRATDIVCQAMNQIRSLLPQAAETAPMATGGGPPNDPYMLPSIMAATIVAGEGWREENLGPETPLDLMAEGAAQRRASLVWLALSVEQPAEEMAAQIIAMNQRLKQASIPLIVGGRGTPPKRMLVEDNIHLISSMSELAAFARGIQSVRRDGQTPPPPSA
jgi:methanogenic corrinoid protein MtbC1